MKTQPNRYTNHLNIYYYSLQALC